ncbi:MAG: AAA family ATPase, partial [Campylobacteraceae bacterium]|nr:AAA family ATPase [Campylobacteraceae bacterium]
TKATLEHILELKNRGNQVVVGLDTGFAKLNELTTGFGKGDLVIVAARPAMGKTALCLNLAQNALDDNKGVAIFSLEMPAEQLMLRMFSSKTSIPLQKIRRGDLSDDEWGRLSGAADEMSGKSFFVDDNGNVDIHKIRSKLRKLKTNHPEISLCIIDYLQLMNGSGNKDRHLEVSDMSRGLKLLARELEMPIVALSQLNRGLESRGDKRPMLSDLRESGAIEQDADIILFVYRDDVYRVREEKEKEQKARLDGKEYKSNFFEKPEENAEIIIGKNRNGPIGVANMIFQKNCTRFVDAGGVPVEIIYGNTNKKEPKISMPTI